MDIENGVWRQTGLIAETIEGASTTTAVLLVTVIVIVRTAAASAVGCRAILYTTPADGWPYLGPDYLGYYADVDGNGSVDGIIYADLARNDSGIYNTSNNRGGYEYHFQNDLKEYNVSTNEVSGFGNWKAPLITAKAGTKGNDRFYVMALKDLDDNAYYWNFSKNEELNDYSYDDFGKGKANTRTLVDKNQNTSDIWGIIQTQSTWPIYSSKNQNNKWFVASRAEWSAFGDVMTKKVDLTTENYSNIYNLKGFYWSSAQNTIDGAYIFFPMGGQIDSWNVASTAYVRLSATF